MYACACVCIYVHIDATFSVFHIEPPQVPLAAASRAVVQESDKGMYMYEECCIYVV